MRTPEERLQDAIEYIVNTAVDCVVNGLEDVPDTVRDVDQYLLRVWGDPEPGLDWEWELRGAIYCANHVLPGSFDDIRAMLARAVHKTLRRSGLLKRQRKAA